MAYGCPCSGVWSPQEVGVRQCEHASPVWSHRGSQCPHWTLDPHFGAHVYNVHGRVFPAYIYAQGLLKVKRSDIESCR